MKINSIQTYNYQNKANKKQNPNFGVRLTPSTAMIKLVQKEYMNLGLSQKGNPYYYNLESITRHFIQNVERLASLVDDIEPKNLEIKMNITPDAVKYINEPYLDGKLFNEKSNQYPMCLGYRYPFSEKEEYEVKGIKMPVNWDDTYELKFKIQEIANEYVELIKKGK